MRVALLSLFLLLGTLPAGAATNDPLRARQWSLDRIKAEAAWATSRGAGMTIAIVDTGVDLGHPDLAGKVIAGQDYVNGDTDPQDDQEHGTHVAGIAGAITGNGWGVAGVAPDAKILAIKVLDSDGFGFSSDIVSGIREATAKRASVINLSLSDILPAEILHDTDIDDAIRDAFNRGSLVVAAAGNNGFPFSNPATADVALVVGATGKNDDKAAYSTAGAGVKIWAPGGDGPPVVVCSQDPNIWSTILRGRGECGQADYDQEAGTSMAAPHVAGVAALVRGVNPSLTPKQVMDILLNTADTVGALSLKRVNAAKAVAAAKSTVSGTSGGGSGQPGTPPGSGGGRSEGTSGSGAGGSQGGGPAGASPTTEPGGTQPPEATDGENGEAGSASDGGESGGNGLLYLVVGALLAAGAVGAVVRARFKASRAPND